MHEKLHVWIDSFCIHLHICKTRGWTKTCGRRFWSETPLLCKLFFSTCLSFYSSSNCTYTIDNSMIYLFIFWLEFYMQFGTPPTFSVTWSLLTTKADNFLKQAYIGESLDAARLVCSFLFNKYCSYCFLFFWTKIMFLLVLEVHGKLPISVKVSQTIEPW